MRGFASVEVLKRSNYDLELIVQPETAVTGVRAALDKKRIEHGIGTASDIRVVGVNEIELGAALEGVAGVVAVFEPVPPQEATENPSPDLL